MTHNPYIILKDGTYYLYYIGNFGNGTYEVHRNNDRIGVASATNPAGPGRASTSRSSTSRPIRRAAPPRSIRSASPIPPSP